MPVLMGCHVSTRSSAIQPKMHYRIWAWSSIAHIVLMLNTADGESHQQVADTEAALNFTTTSTPTSSPQSPRPLASSPPCENDHFSGKTC